MKLKGVTKLTAQMNQFLRPFGVTSVLGPDFCYDPNSEKVQFTITMEEEADKMFFYFISETFNYKVKDLFLLSLLHEVGHHVTLDDFEDEEISADRKIKNRIAFEIDNDNYESKLLEYFNLPTEYAATAWAVSYMRAHEKEICKHWRVMLEHFRHFYKVNGVS